MVSLELIKAEHTKLRIKQASSPINLLSITGSEERGYMPEDRSYIPEECDYVPDKLGYMRRITVI